MSIKLNGRNYDSTINQTYGEAGQVVIPNPAHLAANPELYMPQGTNHFYLYVDLINTNDTDGNPFTSDEEETLRLSVNSQTVPHFSQDIISISVGNGKMKFAGSMTFPEGTLEVNDWIGAATKDILMKWQAKSGNVKTQKVGLASDYKKTAYLVETTPDGQTVRRFKMYGCWISALSEEAHNYENSDARRITATIPYDYAEIDED